MREEQIKLLKVDRQLRTASKKIQLAAHMNLDAYGADGAYNYLLQIIKILESAVIEARKLPMITNDRDPEIDIAEEGENLQAGPIQFETINEIECITMPRLLPKRRSDRSVKRYLAGYYPMIREHYKSCAGLYSTKVVIWFVHYYNQKHKGFRDHDNIETKIMTDMITPFMLKDDAPTYCDIHESSLYGEVDQTEIYVIPKEKFPEFYAKFEHGLAEVSA